MRLDCVATVTLIHTRTKASIPNGMLVIQREKSKGKHVRVPDLLQTQFLKRHITMDAKAVMGKPVSSGPKNNPPTGGTPIAAAA